MTQLKPGDYTGYSDIGIEEAMQDALKKIGKCSRIEIIEISGSHIKGDHRNYQVTLMTFLE